MLNLLPCLPLILLLPVASASTKYLDYYNKIPADYLAEFEQQDRFSALNRFVKDVAASPGLACSDGRSHFPLAAFQLSPAAADAVPDAGMSYKGFDQSKRAGLSMANLLSYMYQLADSQPSKWFRKTGDQAFWYSIVSSVVASDEKVFGCYAVLFDGKGRLNETVPHAFRNDSISRVVTVDSYSKTVSIQADSVGFEWLKYHHDNRERLLAQIRRRVGHSIVPNSKHNLMPFTSKLLKQYGGQVKVVTEAESFWTPPAFACQFGRWLVSYAVPFLNSGTADQLDIGGWVVLQFELERVEINQCRNESTFRSLYANNVCNQGTTECVHIPDQGLSDTNFYCKCRRYFHHGNFSGEQVRTQYLLHRKGSASNYSSLECGPCPAECPGSCATNGDCLIKHDLDILRALPLVIQTFLMTVCVLVAAIVFKTRRNRVIKAAVWILLEIFILGVTILYLTVFLMYLNPTYEICFIIPWFREIGFTITYGTLLVKVYRVLCGFQSRKAHRVHVRDRDLLKYLAGIVAVAFGFMAAWTAATLDHSRRLHGTLESLNCSSADQLSGQLILEDGKVRKEDKELSFRVCAVGYWDAVCAAGELVFLLLGLFYCYCVRSAPSDYSETRYITAAFISELVCSLAYHVIRHVIWDRTHPDYVYLMYFARCHLTVTVTAALVIVPKLWYVHSPPKNAGNNRSLVYSQVDANLGEPMNPMAIAANGDLDAPEINISDMDPEDIRAELKRLYTQLEIFKTKVMRKENPHISKRKGGRKQTHRRFSLQPFYHKHSHKQPAVSVQEEEISKVSEDSSNSLEGQELERSMAKDSGGAKNV
ncbi:hypothetical protein BOX15_Mlig018070g2 [Macrostomum lignano]|uniref:G-protein coupled receptors family 3 profile domain-containing protein n=1 Tax=Macrostomum lignano TaxID=282301 RepID=A0A267DNA1_9PLAT|nr:hypothetical protein BOX15_Mlig018070g2 [Macrostomum lignano]